MQSLTLDGPVTCAMKIVGTYVKQSKAPLTEQARATMVRMGQLAGSSESIRSHDLRRRARHYISTIVGAVNGDANMTLANVISYKKNIL